MLTNSKGEVFEGNFRDLTGKKIQYVKSHRTSKDSQST